MRGRGDDGVTLNAGTDDPCVRGSGTVTFSSVATDEARVILSTGDEKGFGGGKEPEVQDNDVSVIPTQV